MPHTILVVDDDPDSLDIVRTFLESRGYEVYTARDGVSGLALVETVNPALVLLDVMMPGLDGLQVVRRIREHPDHADTKVLLLTARNGSNDKRTGLRSGADDYLVKPIRLDELARRVETSLRARPDSG